jgi:hypothetical protein
MKPSIFSLLILPLFLAWSHAGRAFQELKSYRDLTLPEKTVPTWVIFDIDNTLTHPLSEIGSVEWAEYMRERYIQAGLTPEQATQKQHEIFGLTQLPKNAKVVDESIFRFLQSLPRDFHVFALTARNPNLMMVTTQQLASVSLIGALEANFPKLQQKPAELAIERGIIFANGQDKGKILELMLQNAEQIPAAIYFIDDKTYNVEAFDQAMERVNSDRETKIAYQSYHLTAVEPLLKSFDAAKADRLWYQFRYLNLDSNFNSARPLESPTELARILFSQQAFSLSPDPQEIKCEIRSQKGDLVTTTCSYRNCLKWDISTEESSCMHLSPASEVSYELQYLPDLKIYIRSGWEFLKRD